MRRGSNRKLMGESLSRAGRIANAVINNLPPVHQPPVVCRRRRAVGEPQRAAAAGPGPGSARVPPRVIMSCAPFLPRPPAPARSRYFARKRRRNDPCCPPLRRSTMANGATSPPLILHTADYGVPREYFRSRRPSPIFLHMKLRE